MRRIRLVLLVFVLLLAAASVSIHAGGTLRIVDVQDQPMRAYVAYRYQGSTLNPVHPVTYHAREEIVAADLAAEPTRGIQASRLYGYYSTYFREYEAELR